MIHLLAIIFSFFFTTTPAPAVPPTKTTLKPEASPSYQMHLNPNLPGPPPLPGFGFPTYQNPAQRE